VCPSQIAASALPRAQGVDDEGGANQGLHFPPRSPHFLQAGTCQSSQVCHAFHAVCSVGIHITVTRAEVMSISYWYSPRKMHTQRINITHNFAML